jgi:CrcB protein
MPDASPLYTPEPPMPRASLETILFIGAGGFLGAIARYLVSLWAAERFGVTFPWGTLIANVSGGLLLAAFATWFTRQADIQPALRLFLAVGFCGAYTTFSTYALDTITMAQTGQWSASLANLLVNNALCFIAVLAGLWIGARIG